MKAIYSFLVLIILVIGIVGCESNNELVSPNSITDQPINADQTHNKKGTIPGPVQQLATGLEGASGSTIGPGGDLFVTEGAVGRISRVDPKTGDVTTFASGFPPFIIGYGGVTDLVFMGSTAYALVTLVDDPLFPTGAVNGIYRVDGPNSFTIIADLGAYNLAHQPTGFNIIAKTGVLFSIQKYHGGFLVTDGHLNRVLHVTLDGKITQVQSFGNIVPTGLEVHGKTVFMTEAGPVPHLPQDGKLVSFSLDSPTVTTIATGARLLVDVEMGRGQTLFVLSQGIFEEGTGEGEPAMPNTGSLLRINADGTFTVIADELDRPTSLEFKGTTAYIVTVAGEIITIDNVTGPPFGR